MKPSSFHIFDASAGSGKTFSLVKEYLKVIFESNLIEPYKYVLALTFTNKAVAEMKQRILQSLRAFSSEDILSASNHLFLTLCNELDLKPEILHEKSKELLDSIIHNYAAFDISTIDRFNQKLIRTFAFDLKVPSNFEVELDTEDLLEKAVDNLISKAGSDKELTQILLSFAIEKIDDDKSWDIAYDFNQIAKLLLSENDHARVRSLNSKSLSDFNEVKEKLAVKIYQKEKALVKKASEVLQFIDECGLEHNDFAGRNGLVPSYFLKISQSNFNIPFDKVWMEKIETHPLYPQNSPENIKQTIDEIQSTIVGFFNETKQMVIRLKLLKSIYKNLTPLSVLNSIYKEIDVLKEEENKVLISEFNAIVGDHIKTQPAPFIYERIGEKFKHFFIDEFQDTSVMQWQNLTPLIANALSSERTSAMIVGDAKQAIYRWRGGKAEQFIGLCQSDNPFQIEKTVHHLEENYRSFKSIVTFNNGFFEYLSQLIFSDEKYARLYKGSTQKTILEDDGYVEINFLDLENEEDKHLLYSSKVLEHIESSLQNGFEEKDICILVRYKKEGIAIADYLNAHSDYNIISSETLLLTRSPEVNFIINLLKLVIQPAAKEHKFAVAEYLVNNKLDIEDSHDYFLEVLDIDLRAFFESLEQHGIFCNYSLLLQLPIYEAIEVIVHDFDLVPDSNAYVQFLLDFALEYINNHHSSLNGFLTHFDDKKEKLSIVFPEGINAIQIMTIHKAKGLEFPVVIFPYADLDIYQERQSKVWLPLTDNTIKDLDLALINYNKEIKEFGNKGAELYWEHKAEMELDNINLLYVTLTRAISHLYVVSRMKPSRKNQDNIRSYGELFINYFKHLGIWTDQQSCYSFGNPSKTFKSDDAIKASVRQKKFISTPHNKMQVQIVTNSGYLWDSSQQRAMEKGNLIHLIMAQIHTKIDVDFSFTSLLRLGTINAQQLAQLRPTIMAIINHPELSAYFTHDYSIYNERDIIQKNGPVLRPDRVVINEANEAVIIDYKSGKIMDSHTSQMTNYKLALERQGFQVLKAILVYVNDDIKIKEM